MAGGLQLKRPPTRRVLISVISMIDVMMILLFFFMVTSTYLNLDMIPALQSTDDPVAEGAAPMATGAPTAPLLIRITAAGLPATAGQTLSPEALARLLQARLAADPLTSVILLPSGGARLQDLITTMDQITRAGVVRLKVVRLEAKP